MSRPRLRLGRHLWRGLGAVALFVVLAVVSLRAPLGEAAGFGDGSITASIGYAIVGLGTHAAHETESFLAAFEIVDVVLVAALVAAVMLARRESGGPLSDALGGGDEE